MATCTFRITNAERFFLMKCFDAEIHAPDFLCVLHEGHAITWSIALRHEWGIMGTSLADHWPVLHGGLIG